MLGKSFDYIIRRGVQNIDILKNTDAMGKRIFADLEKINFIRTSTSAEETRDANIIKDEQAK